LFSTWYSWNIAELALNNNHSPTHLLLICLYHCVAFFLLLFVCLFFWFCFCFVLFVCLFVCLIPFYFVSLLFLWHFVCFFVFLQSNPPFIQKLLGHSVLVFAMIMQYIWNALISQMDKLVKKIWIYLWVRALGLWCLTSLSTIFQLYHDSQFIGRGNWSPQEKTTDLPFLYCKHTYSFLNGFYNVGRLTGTSGSPYDMQVWSSIWIQKLSISYKKYAWKFIHVRICPSYSLVVYKYHRTINLFYTYINN